MVENDETLQTTVKFEDKVNIIETVEIKYRTENVNVYECDGYRNYMYSYMLPSTGYLKSYKFEMYYPGFMVLYPRSEASGLIPEFKDEPNFIRALANANNWSMLTESENIYEINERCKDEEELKKFIFMCEARHDHQLYELGNKIESNIDKIRLIAIAGPSSSGKTTFSKRLEIELLSRNIHPIRISLDNYYKEGGIAPIGIDGKPDYEHIDSLDVDLFNQDMSDFLDGLPVSLPIYNFKDKSRTFSKPLTLKKDNVIIIEGIHALNDKMTKSIPFDAKFKIYIVPLAQRNIDNHSPISLTDLRLLRRIVRDKNFRFTSALETLESWPSVRRGEYKWIYPYMENADFIFNSELGYEILALKKYAFESLKEIDKMSPEYINANSLLKFLKVYRSIDDDLIPNSSLIREFIGKSVFSD